MSNIIFKGIHEYVKLIKLFLGVPSAKRRNTASRAHLAFGFPPSGPCCLLVTRQAYDTL
jgi:hypothetical protein